LKFQIIAKLSDSIQNEKNTIRTALIRSHSSSAVTLNGNAYQLSTVVQQNFGHVRVSVLTGVRQRRVTGLGVSVDVGAW